MADGSAFVGHHGFRRTGGSRKPVFCRVCCLVVRHPEQPFITAGGLSLLSGPQAPSKLAGTKIGVLTISRGGP